tara:strand:- start:404 stop:829 length:426 start_codon:yes stop_codon:yes gene_type:complete
VAEWSNAAVLKTVVPQGTGGSNPSSSAYLHHIVNSDFFKNVYEVVKLIPSGKVTSYGAIAKYLGTSKSARVVGWAMNNSHHDKTIPAHRVVNRNGLLTGKHHFHGKKTMEELLEKEGILVKKNRIENFEEVFWDPIKELEL